MMTYEIGNFEINVRRFTEGGERKISGVIKLDGERIYGKTSFNNGNVHNFWFMADMMVEFCLNRNNNYNHRLWLNNALFMMTVEFQNLFASADDYREELDEINQIKYSIFHDWVEPVAA